jgi:hypothetical protein
MKRLTQFLASLAIWLGFLSVGHAADDAIRSAQMFTRGGEWATVAPRGEEAERAEIQDHFAAVLGRLQHDTPYSLRIAEARFERAFGLTLTPGQRAEFLDGLALRREIQLNRLAAYAGAGRFPLNRHYADEARPIFVDAKGTHCAVGYLMAMDGLEADVLAIARAAPNVLVREVADGPLVFWTLTSGLIQEEAALIQPSYFPPPFSANNKGLGDLVVPGAQFDQNGFRFESFAFSAASSGGAVTPVASQFVLVPGYFGPGFQCPPQCYSGQPAFWVGVLGSFSFDFLATGPNQSMTVNIDYDVVALLNDLAVGGSTTYETAYTGGFGKVGALNPLGQASIATRVDGGTSGVLELLLTNESYASFGFGEDSDSADFGTPVKRVHVHHRIQLGDGASFSSFHAVISPTTVPIPNVAPVLGFALLALGKTFAGKRRSLAAP